MLIIFRCREDVHSFSQQVFELCETNLNYYETHFVVLHTQPTNLSHTTLDIFKKNNQNHTPGRTFFYVNITSDFDSTIISVLLTNFHQTRFCSIGAAVRELWNSCQSWGSCFDLINSFLYTKPVAVIESHFNDYLSNFPHNYLCDASDHESDFSIDGGLWSVTIVTFPLIEVAPGVSTSNPLTPVSQTVAIVTTCHEGEEDWEVITTSEEFESLERTEMSEIFKEVATDSKNNAYCKQISMLKSSYRDVLLKTSITPTTNVSDSPRSVRQKSTWKPALIVTNTPYLRSDRVYGPHYEGYEDDGNGCWDFVDAHALRKFDTALTRKRGIVMVTPKAQEKKDQKMKAKATSTQN